MRLTGQSRDHHRRRPGHRPGDRAQVRARRAPRSRCATSTWPRSTQTVERRQRSGRRGPRLPSSTSPTRTVDRTDGRGRDGQVGPHRLPGQQRRHRPGRAVQEDDRGPVRPRHRRQPEGRLQLHQGGGGHHAGAELGLHPATPRRSSASTAISARPTTRRPSSASSAWSRPGRASSAARASAPTRSARASSSTPILASMPEKVLRMIEEQVPMGRLGQARGDRQHLRVARLRRGVVHQRRGDRGFRRRHHLMASSPARPVAALGPSPRGSGRIALVQSGKSHANHRRPRRSARCACRSRPHRRRR